jgi:TM2 domain-containing membrane protein YozV
VPNRFGALICVSFVRSNPLDQPGIDKHSEPKQFKGVQIMSRGDSTHSVFMGYLLWIFGFMGAHRFYYGKQISGVIWFFTLGLFFVGWIIDLFLIPAMEREAERRYVQGDIDYDLTWILLTFLGIFGIHRLYMGKIFTGILYMFTGGLFLIGILWDFLTLNEQISDANEGY